MSPDQTKNTVARPPTEFGSVDTAADDTAAPSAATTSDAARPPFAPPTEPGDIGRLGKYRIQRELGRGGMGAVYLAFDERLQRKVALKVMLPKAAADATAKDRFLREARAAAQISSDHVVNIYEADETDGVPFIALQYLQGYPLDEYLKKKGTPSLPQVVRLGRETALGLAAAHKLGLVHRDIKPGNVWLEAPSGRVKILDFGLAKPVVGREQAELTASGAIVGTPAYMAPEQGLGRKLDGRADLFSLGCMLYRLVTGRLPFEGPTLMAVLTAVATGDPPPVRTLNPQVPDRLADLIHRLLAKTPADRPAAATDVVKELDAISTVPRKPPAEVDPDAPTVFQPPAVYTPIAVSVQHDNPFEHLVDDEPSDEPAPKAAARRGKSPPWVLIAVAVVGLLGLVTTAGVIIIRITNKDGSTTEIKVPEGAKVEVSKDGKSVVTVGPEVRPPAPPAPPAVKSIPPTAAGDGLPGLRIDEKDTFVAVEVPTLKAPADGPLTLEGYVKFDHARLGENPTFFGWSYQYTVGTSGLGLGLCHYTAGEKGDQWKQNVARTPDDLARGTWHHLAIVRDGKMNRLYLNGKLTAKEEVTEAIRAANPATAGDGQFVLGSVCDGVTLREVRVSKTVRYNKDFTPASRHDPDQDTLALYHCDDGKGDVLTDSSGNKHHGKINGARWVTAAADPDRKAAEWVLSVGGDVVLNGERRAIKSAAELPTGAFQLTAVDLRREIEPRATDAGLASFNGCRHLTTLVLHSERVSDAGLAHFSECTKLTHLDVSSSAVTDAGLAHFKNNKSLTSLSLASERITDTGLAHFDECKRLTYLNLIHTKVTNAGLARFKGCAELSQLWLTNSSVSDTSVEVIRGFTELQVLHLKGTKVTEAGAKRLAAALPKCKIEWGGGVIEPSGKPGGSGVAPLDPAWVKAVAAIPPEKQYAAVFAELKRRNPEFTEKGPRNGRVIEQGVLTELTLDGRLADVTPARALAGLTRLFVCNTPDLNAAPLPLADLSQFQGMKLSHLSVWYAAATDLTPLKGMPLTSLDLFGTKVTDLTPLAGMPLTALSLRSCPVEDLTPIRGLKLKDLSLIGTQVPDLIVAAGMPLESLQCGSRITDLTPLKGKKLKLLVFAGDVVSDLSPLKGMPLEELGWWGSNVTDLSPLEGMPLKALNYDLNLARDGKLLRSLKSLEKLNGKPAKDVLK